MLNLTTKRYSCFFILAISVLYLVLSSAVVAVDDEPLKISPGSVVITPKVLNVRDVGEVVPAIASSLDALNHNKGIDLDILTPEYLRSLYLTSPSHFQQLMMFLSKFPVKVEWYDSEGLVRSGRAPVTLKQAIHMGTHDRTNAAVGLLLKSSSDYILVAQMLAVATNPILENLKGNAHAVLTTQAVSHALSIMINALKFHGSDRDIKITKKVTTNLVCEYISYWSQQDPAKMEKRLYKLGQSISTYIAHNSMTPMQIGILMGGIFSGTYYYARNIRHSDQRQTLIVNSITSMVWACSTYISLIGLAAPLAAPAIIVSASVGAAAVFAASLWALRCGPPRDFTHQIKEMQGDVEAFMLKGCEGNFEKERVCGKILHWMNSTIHTNGLAN